MNKIIPYVCLLMLIPFLVLAEEGNENSDSATLLISDIMVTDITYDSAVISWQTDSESDSKIDYGETTEFGQIVSDDKKVLIHIMTLSNLNSASDYHFTITSCSDECSTSEVYSFITGMADFQTPPGNDDIEEIIESVADDANLADTEQVIEQVRESIQYFRKRGSLVVGMGGVYQTYQVGTMKKIIVKSSATKKIVHAIVELARTGSDKAVLTLNGKIYTLTLRDPVKVDIDSDGTYDFEMTLVSLPWPSAAKVYFISTQGKVDKEIVFELEDIFDIPDDEVIEDMIEDAIEHPKILPIQKTSKWVYVIGVVALLSLLYLFHKRK